ncbi:N-acetyltransferase [Aquidulcibacter sp.]|uniref:GNAT family N-acetyltransferase n=1 Tax=Aquidulcibacter sp. TaxID=2052990 RepID=UPI0025BD913A|nr:GNAT family N-acetyltransferase [Aquidulcibacter sp.]MCA3695358.1 GNAT family N-acetyltransferase [Aquidulcibacter sp.]
MNLNLPDGMKRADAHDWQQLGSITAEAFHEDPVNRWIFGTPKTLDAVFPLLARTHYLKHGFCHMIGDGGAAMWLPWGAPSEISLAATVQVGWALLATGSPGAIGRALDAGARMQAHHPKEPHLYLYTLGTRLASRGKGVGKALFAPVLAECDRTGTAVYLENSNPNNEGFYRSHGFESQGYFPCGQDRGDQKAPLLQMMWRAPRTPPA